ncbi:hypothetical protein GCM10010358_38490 [Streptomyces minutiscleroticus]|uniref:Uncharacterized protein n=1 Tax=Streptomyces minutiscleroticus TaxID=68238 RepID=A0A918NM89_9ACTN|nr:hypothetical protein [Streptomyces minutiscleroticus]GGX80425.1 hypothetical protein GCM10010358_38490 [Streptomyces minutiscleroticus]
MSGAEFYPQDASARASWRLAVSMGAHARTYKFALGQALLEFGRQGQEAVPLAEFAAAYAWMSTRVSTWRSAGASAGCRTSRLAQVRR